MRKSNLVFIAVLLISAPALAQVGAANNPVTNSANDSRTTMSQPNNDTVNAPDDPSLNEVTCKNEPPPTGTRSGGKRICKTNREWRQDEDAMNRQRELNGNTDFSKGQSAMGAGGH